MLKTLQDAGEEILEDSKRKWQLEADLVGVRIGLWTEQRSQVALHHGVCEKQPSLWSPKGLGG